MSEMPGVPAAITPETESFWEAGTRGELVVEQCHGCGLHVFPPRGVCRRCHGRELSLCPVRAPGVVYSQTRNHNAWSPGGPEVYTVVLVEFPDYSGVRFVGTYSSESPPRIGELVDFTLVPAFDRRFQITFSPWSAS